MASYNKIDVYVNASAPECKRGDCLIPNGNPNREFRKIADAFELIQRLLTDEKYPCNTNRFGIILSPGVYSLDIDLRDYPAIDSSDIYLYIYGPQQGVLPIARRHQANIEAEEAVFVQKTGLVVRKTNVDIDGCVFHTANKEVERALITVYDVDEGMNSANVVAYQHKVHIDCCVFRAGNEDAVLTKTVASPNAQAGAEAPQGFAITRLGAVADANCNLFINNCKMYTVGEDNQGFPSAEHFNPATTCAVAIHAFDMAQQSRWSRKGRDRFSTCIRGTTFMRCGRIIFSNGGFGVNIKQCWFNAMIGPCIAATAASDIQIKDCTFSQVYGCAVALNSQLTMNLDAMAYSPPTRGVTLKFNKVRNVYGGRARFGDDARIPQSVARYLADEFGCDKPGHGFVLIGNEGIVVSNNEIRNCAESALYFDGLAANGVTLDQVVEQYHRSEDRSNRYWYLNPNGPYHYGERKEGGIDAPVDNTPGRIQWFHYKTPKVGVVGHHHHVNMFATNNVRFFRPTPDSPLVAGSVVGRGWDLAQLQNDGDEIRLGVHFAEHSKTQAHKSVFPQSELVYDEANGKSVSFHARQQRLNYCEIVVAREGDVVSARIESYHTASSTSKVSERLVLVDRDHAVVSGPVSFALELSTDGRNQTAHLHYLNPSVVNPYDGSMVQSLSKLKRSESLPFWIDSNISLALRTPPGSASSQRLWVYTELRSHAREFVDTPLFAGFRAFVNGTSYNVAKPFMFWTQDLLSPQNFLDTQKSGKEMAWSSNWAQKFDKKVPGQLNGQAFGPLCRYANFATCDASGTVIECPQHIDADDASSVPTAQRILDSRFMVEGCYDARLVVNGGGVANVQIAAGSAHVAKRNLYEEGSPFLRNEHGLVSSVFNTVFLGCFQDYLYVGVAPEIYDVNNSLLTVDQALPSVSTVVSQRYNNVGTVPLGHGLRNMNNIAQTPDESVLYNPNAMGQYTRGVLTAGNAQYQLRNDVCRSRVQANVFVSDIHFGQDDDRHFKNMAAIAYKSAHGPAIASRRSYFSGKIKSSRRFAHPSSKGALEFEHITSGQPQVRETTQKRSASIAVYNIERHIRPGAHWILWNDRVLPLTGYDAEEIRDRIRYRLAGGYRHPTNAADVNTRAFKTWMNAECIVLDVCFSAVAYGECKGKFGNLDNLGIEYYIEGAPQLPSNAHALGMSWNLYRLDGTRMDDGSYVECGPDGILKVVQNSGGDCYVAAVSDPSRSAWHGAAIYSYLQTKIFDIGNTRMIGDAQGFRCLLNPREAAERAAETGPLSSMRAPALIGAECGQCI